MTSTLQDNARKTIETASSKACDEINIFSKEVFHTRGGRIGSGMGTLLEALWGYFINKELKKVETNLEMAWIPNHEYNDFVCVMNDQEWNPATKAGEVLRIEAKSMILSADESKAHFAQLKKEIDKNDLLLVLVWDWDKIDETHISPKIFDSFIGLALPIAEMRDRLHISRGGSFVCKDSCPDQCSPSTCTHDGEPLNANGKRERLTGPEETRVSRNVSFAANFGGMVRMLKTTSDAARKEFRLIRKVNDVAHKYISFIHKNIPSEELNQYSISEWRALANILGLKSDSLSKPDLVQMVRNNRPDYRDIIRNI